MAMIAVCLSTGWAGLQGKHGTTAAPMIKKCVMSAYFVSVLCAVSCGHHFCHHIK